MILWSSSQHGFYRSEIHSAAQIPSDAVEITEADYSALLDAQSAGRPIVSRADGTPHAPEPAAPPIATLRTAARDAVDRAAEAARLAFITAGEGQSMVYQAKAAEAAAAEADPAPDAADYPLLAAEVGITAPETGDMAADIKAVAAVVTAMRGAWLTAAAAIEATRLGAKAAIDAAGDGAAIQAVLDALDWPAPG